MSEYVPGEEDFIDSWACAHVAPHDMTANEAKDAARAFLARVRRDAAREALDGLAEHIDWTASRLLGVRVGSQKAQDVRDYRDEHYPEETDR